MNNKFTKTLARVTSATMLMLAVFISHICAQVVQKPGNDDMKVYGLALEAGTLTPTVKAGTIPTGSGITYFVDATNGNDANNGTTISTAWKSIDKVNSVTFQPGDRLLFKAGEIWTAPTAPKTNGSLPADVDEDQDGRPEIC